MKNRLKNFVFPALVFLAGTAWANALTTQQAEANLRHALEGAQVANTVPAASVQPGRADSSLNLLLEPVPVQSSFAAPPQMTLKAWDSSDADWNMNMGAIGVGTLGLIGGAIAGVIAPFVLWPTSCGCCAFLMAVGGLLGGALAGMIAGGILGGILGFVVGGFWGDKW